jgi:hypothetical protein
MATPLNERWHIWKWGLAAALSAMGILFVFHLDCGSPFGCSSDELEKTAGLSATGYSWRAATKPASITKSMAVSEQTITSDGPMIVQSVSFRLTTASLSGIRAKLDDIVSRSQGYTDKLAIQSDSDSNSVLATLRIPADRLEPALNDLRMLGTLKEEAHTSQDVTAGYTDLVARLSNARRTEQRLLNLLNERTGKLAEVVQVEKEIGDVRERIEQMETQQRRLQNQTRFASVEVQVTAESAAEHQAIAVRLRIALVAGYRKAVDNILALTLLALRFGPTTLIYLLLLAPITAVVWRRFLKTYILR